MRSMRSIRKGVRGTIMRSMRSMRAKHAKAWQACEQRCEHLGFACSALNIIRLRFPYELVLRKQARTCLRTGFHTMSSFMNQAAQRDVMHLINDCEHSHDNLELVEFLALAPAMLSHSNSLAKPLSSR